MPLIRRNKAHTVVCHSRRGQNTKNVPAPRGEDRQDETENTAKNRQSCAAIEQPDYPDEGPAMSRGGSARRKRNAKATLNPAYNTRKRVLSRKEGPYFT